MNTILAKDLKEFIKSEFDLEKHLIVDVRTKEEYLDGHIPYAVNIDLEVVESAMPIFNKFEKVFINCRSGARSQQACEAVSLPNVVNVIGGYLAFED